MTDAEDVRWGNDDAITHNPSSKHDDAMATEDVICLDKAIFNWR
jgi:hypothetical protein